MVTKPWELPPGKSDKPSESSAATTPAKTPSESTAKPGKKKIYRYPFDRIDEGDDYLLVEIIDFVPGAFNLQGQQSFALVTTDQTLAKDKQIVQERIILPIPESIGDTNNANWENDDMGPFTSLLTGAFSQGLSQASSPNANILDATGATVRALAGSVVSLGLSKQASDSIKSGAANLAARKITGGKGDITTAINRATGFTLNPNSQLLFNGTTQRQFQFSWDLVPRSKKESDEIKAIIRLLKGRMSPRKGAQAQAGAGFFIKSPEVFQLSYMTGSKPHPFLNRFKPMALTSMNVNYTASGTYATYSDSTPVHLQMTLSFSELTPIYREDYDTKEGKDGVGY